jgi:hypothetical protein
MKTIKFLFVFLLFASINTIYPQLKKTNGIETLCGTDNRVASSYKAVGRIYTEPGGEVGTGWILSDGRIVTAAHVLYAINSAYIEFNVPPSPDCSTLGRPPLTDRYVINLNSIVKPSSYNVGNDWAIFKVNPNAITGLTPIEAQNAYYFVEQTTTPGNIQVIGYGNSSICSRYFWYWQLLRIKRYNS